MPTVKHLPDVPTSMTPRSRNTADATATHAETAVDEDDLRERVTRFLRRNFPQIEMHGGSAAIQDLDLEAGSVRIRLGGACSGCGISPMTTQALKTRLVQEIPGIRRVETETGAGDDGTPRGFDADDVPF